MCAVALQSDHRFSQWMPKLVPRRSACSGCSSARAPHRTQRLMVDRPVADAVLSAAAVLRCAVWRLRVSEEQFWRNYLSHVAAVLHSAGLITQQQAVNAVTTAAVQGTEQPPPLRVNGTAVSPSPPPQPSVDAAGKSAPSTVPPSAAAAGALLTAAPTPWEVRWGVVGSGRRAERALRSLTAARGARVVAVCGASDTAVVELAARWTIPVIAPSLEALLEHPTVDCVHIACAMGSARYGCRALVGERCASYGKAAVVERPMARSLVEGQSLVAAFDAAAERYRSAAAAARDPASMHRAPPRGVPPRLFVHQPLLSLHCAAGMRQRVAGVQTVTSIAYSLSAPLMLQARHAKSPYVFPENSGCAPITPALLACHGGPTFAYLCDLFDLLHWALGQPVWNVRGDAMRSPYSASSTTAPVEAIVSCTFRCGSALGSANIDLSSLAQEDRLVIKGTAGELITALYPDHELDQVQRPTNSSMHASVNAAQLMVDAMRQRRPPSADRVNGTSATAAVQNGAASPTDEGCLLDGRTALRSLACADAALRSFYRLRSDAFWDRPHTWSDHEQLYSNVELTAQP